MSQNIKDSIKQKISEDISPTKNLSGLHLKIVMGIAIIWTLFQLWYASPFPFWFNFGMFKGLPARAIHLGFALTLTFLIFPIARGKKINFYDILISLVAAFCCLYIYFFYDDLVNRGGILLVKEIFGFKVPVELIIGTFGILILLEATRRAIGLPLVIIAICFLLFSYFGKYAPDIISGAYFPKYENKRKQIAIITRGKPIALLVASNKINIPKVPIINSTGTLKPNISFTNNIPPLLTKLS